LRRRGLDLMLKQSLLLLCRRDPVAQLGDAIVDGVLPVDDSGRSRSSHREQGHGAEDQSAGQVGHRPSFGGRADDPAC
jgi:hypothetical protein